MPKAEVELRYLRAFDPKIPFYDRTPENREIRAALVRFLDAVGTHLICPRAACRREGGCADRDPAALPFCWTQYRGTVRFLLQVAGRRLGVDRDGPRVHAPEGEAPAAEQPVGGMSLLAGLAARGVPIERLARSVEDGPERWGWESEPELCAAFARLTGPGNPCGCTGPAAVDGRFGTRVPALFPPLPPGYTPAILGDGEHP